MSNSNTAVVDSLRHVLADSFTLYFKTHAYHWNVTGPQFKTLHDLFEEQYTEMWTAIDEIAERIRMIGAMAPHSVQDMMRDSDLNEATDIPAAMDMVKDLAQDHATLARHLKPAIQAASDVGDDATEDFLIARLAVHEKAAWMLRSLAA